MLPSTVTSDEHKITAIDTSFKWKMSRFLFCFIIRPTDGFGHAQMIIDLMDPSNYNNNYYKDRFLGNMYRIVS